MSGILRSFVFVLFLKYLSKKVVLNLVYFVLNKFCPQIFRTNLEIVFFFSVSALSLKQKSLPLTKKKILKLSKKIKKYYNLIK